MRKRLVTAVACLSAIGSTLVAGGTAHAVSPPACTGSYHTLNESASGFVAQVSVANTGSSAISGWTITFTFPNHRVTASWNATVQQSGTVLTATNAAWDGSIPAGGSIYGFGLYGEYWRSDTPPADIICRAY